MGNGQGIVTDLFTAACRSSSECCHGCIEFNDLQLLCADGVNLATPRSWVFAKFFFEVYP